MGCGSCCSIDMDIRPTRNLALCAGVGGLELGLRVATGAATVCYVEREAYSAAVLVARMADGVLDEAPIWSDIGTFDGRPWRGVVDSITAGFPCQPVSTAGKRLGTDDPRWLWPHVARIIHDVGPRWVFLENVPGLIHAGLGNVLGSLAGLGFDAEWGVFSAAGSGAPHLRRRVFILADANGEPLGRLAEPRAERRDWPASAKLRGVVDGSAEGLDSTGPYEPHIMGSHDSARTRPNQDLPSVRPAHDPQAFQRPAGGPQRVPSSEVLQPSVLGHRSDQKPSDPFSDREALGETAWRLLRALRDRRRPDGDAPQGSQPVQQRTLQLTDALQFVSHHHPSRGRGDQPLAVEGALQYLRQAIGQAWSVQYPSDPPEAAWESLFDEEKDWTVVAACLGPWWSEWPETARVAEGVAFRVDRLRAIGNGVVPAVAARAWLTLAERL